jgi:3-hydroxybutyryl-CoA dehydrogenase
MHSNFGGWIMGIEKVFVIGAGQMGNGIAQICAAGGQSVFMQDINQDFLDRGMATIDKNLSRGVKKGKMTDDLKNEILARITPTLAQEDAADVDLVIEAATEKIDLKKLIFKKMDEVTNPNIILATNTSSLSVTEIAAATSRPEKVIGLHFFNPVPVMRLIEIVRGIQTSDETYSAIEKLSVKLGKTPVEVQDFPGFISNRVLMIMINEAIFSLYESVATAEAIDTVMKLGMNHPMGPLELADLIGLDTCLHIMDRLHSGFKDPKFRPCPLLVNMVNAGYFGRKSGRGFYTYDK